jgi:hypothetical protein
MELKRPQNKSWIATITDKTWRRRVNRIVLFGLYTVGILALGALAIGTLVVKTGIHREILSKYADQAKVIPRIPGNMARGLLADPEHITIDIQHEDFMRLAYQREIALNRFLLLTGDNDFVPATISHDGKTVDARIRIKGDFLDHLEENKWSFRIEVRGEDTLFRMKRFSIQHPQTRNYIYEWLYHQALSREGMASLRYEFINVTVNGKDWGIYALEEHFEKRLIENNELREGPIVRFNEELRWSERFQQRPHLPNADPEGDDLFFSVDIDTFQTNQMLSDPTSYAQHSQAMHLLESFRQGELRTSEVFDVEKLATFYAINDLMGAQHSSLWGNVRFYYNPITSLLEPIGFDGDSGLRISALSKDLGPQAGPKFFERIFSDTVFMEEYVETLERVSKPGYLDSLLADLEDDLESKLGIIYSEFPGFYFSTEPLYQNQQYIDTALNPLKGLHAYYHQVDKNRIELELGNIQSIPIEVLSVSYQDSVLFHPRQPIILSGQPTMQAEPIDYQVASFEFPRDFVWNETMLANLQVNYRLLGTSHMRQEIVFPWSYLPEDFIGSDFIRQDANFREFDFLVIDDETQEIFVKSGTWTLDQDLIISEGFRVFAGEDTRLNLVDAAKLLSYSPLEFGGSEDHPIIVQSTDSTGQGIVVIGAEQMSVIDNVSFENLSNPSQGGWELTGAVTFYESPVQISGVQFLNNHSEDALNIVRSNFSIDESVFNQTLFDALDIDFSEGTLTNSSFVEIGNDAVDLSGSVVHIQDISINGAGDKGLSIGENSQLTASDVEIRNALIAIASKDSSRTTIRNIDIQESEYGLAAYVKKPEFGPASLEAQFLTMNLVRMPYVVERHSLVTVDGEVIEASLENVYEMLYSPN